MCGIGRGSNLTSNSLPLLQDVAGAISAALVALIMGKQIPPGWGFWASVQSNGALLPVASLEPYYVDMMKV